MSKLIWEDWAWENHVLTRINGMDIEIYPSNKNVGTWLWKCDELNISNSPLKSKEQSDAKIEVEQVVKMELIKKLRIYSHTLYLLEEEENNDKTLL